MKFEKLQKLTSNLTYFDLSFLVQMSREKRSHLLVQLGRWLKKGKVTPLRRGLYTLGENHCKSFNPAEFAFAIYEPSYLSLEWALSFYGLIPEKTVLWTSVTTRVTRNFRNYFGNYTYQKIHRRHFWGFVQKIMQNRPVWLASPEKAILDYFYLHSGGWNESRLLEMRWQIQEILDLETWHKDHENFKSKRFDQRSG